MNDWQQYPIYTREDDSYVILRNGYHYHVPNAGEWAELWTEVRAWAQTHPEQVEAEPTPPEPTEEELREQRVQAIQARLQGIDQESARAVRSALAGTATEEDRAKLQALEEESKALRAELNTLK